MYDVGLKYFKDIILKYFIIHFKLLYNVLKLTEILVFVNEKSLSVYLLPWLY